MAVPCKHSRSQPRHEPNFFGPNMPYVIRVTVFPPALVDTLRYKQKGNMMRRRNLIKHHPIACLLILLLCGCAQAFAADVSLAWDPSPSAGVTGYKLYVGSSSRTYGAPITIGNQTQYTVTGLSAGTYFFAVTAYDANGNESGFSNEVSETIANTRTCNINGDNSVNILDLQMLANVIIGAGQSSSTYDLNSDGRVDVLDLQILNNVILGLRSCP